MDDKTEFSLQARMDGDAVIMAINVYAEVTRDAFNVEALLKTLQREAGVEYTLSPGIGNEIRLLAGGTTLNKLQCEVLFQVIGDTLNGHAISVQRAEPCSRSQRGCIAFLSLIAPIAASPRGVGDREQLFQAIVNNAHWWTAEIDYEDVARAFRSITSGLLGLTAPECR